MSFLAVLSCFAFLVAGGVPQTTPHRLPLGIRDDIASGCPVSGPLSCHNTSSVTNSCCFESPGGLLLQTQFWDTNPSTGPNNSWTIHGLWPDNCDGTFEQDCDPSRAYTDIASLLTSQGADDTLSFMQQFWVDINGQNEQFWEHEWAKHGTCMSTLNPDCLPSGSPRGAEAVAFFRTVVKLFQSLPTFQWLASQGITPSSGTTFSLSQITNALTVASGGIMPAIQCAGSDLNAISWYFNLRGSIIDGNFVPIATPIPSTCPSTGIRYPLKSGGSTSTPPPAGQLFRAHVHVIMTSTGTSVGGLLSLGTWSTQTLATYTATGTDLSRFTLKSSKGPCGVDAGVFKCGSDVTFTDFSAISSKGLLLLASDGDTAFSSDGVPSGQTVFTVFTGSGHNQAYILSIVQDV
ncbi:RNase Gf29 [Marasmius fiardii PR-910]|nr:RNase Gf29 [Marasmius fiardii PR-910]